MGNLKLSNGKTVNDTFGNTVLQNRQDAITFGVDSFGWLEDDILDRTERISITTVEDGEEVIDLRLGCIMTDSGSDDYLYYITFN